MNQVFYIEELVQRIASSADDEPAGSASLLALACCCKSLEDPVMEVLWQRQKDLQIVLRTLPADCWAVTNKVYRLTRPPTASEWKRFARYAARVIELSIGQAHTRGVSSKTISFLAMRSTLDPLWPRLAALRLTNGLSWNAMPHALAFLSPKIKNFTLTLPPNNDILLQPILSIASDRCRSVQELTLDIVADDPVSVHGVAGLISACRDTLRTLEVRSPFKAEYLPIIAGLPQLRALRLEKACLPCDLAPFSFRTLEEVALLRFHGPRLLHFFDRICSTNLKVVKIYAADAIPFTKSLTALSKFSASLKVLEIGAVANLRLPYTVAPYPLFASLRKLFVECLRGGDGGTRGPCMLRPTDQAIAEFGAAIPSVTHLTLGSPTCPHLHHVTFLSLVSLSKACQDLESLVIGVDFQSMVASPPCGSEDTEADMASEGAQGNLCKLRKLVVGSSTLPDYPGAEWLVAVGLWRVFPSLSEVGGYWSSQRGKWEEVGGNIRMLRQVLLNVGM